MGASAETLPSDFEAGLVDLLLSGFPGDNELRTFVAKLSVGRQVEIRLPGPIATRLDLAQETVRLLREFDGLDEALSAVERERPNSQRYVMALRELPRAAAPEAQPPRSHNPAPALPHVYFERNCFARFRDSIVSAPRRFAGVTGALGVGKTTLAAALAHSPHIQDRFARICWLALDEGTGPPITALQAQLFTQLGGQANFQPNHWRVGLATLSDQASKVLAAGERMLIVIDDPPSPVDNTFAALQVHPNATLLMCSENRAALQSLGADPFVDLDPMTVDESLKLLAQWCQSCPDDLPDAAREIVVAIGGLPLAAAIIGAMVSLAGDRDAEWAKLRKDIVAGRVDQLEIAGLENANFMAIFRRGLGALRERDLNDLHTLAVAPADWRMNPETLRILWAAGDVDDARRRADRLTMRSLLRRLDASNYVLHRLLRLALRALDDRLAQRFRNVADRAAPAIPPLVLALSWRDGQIFKSLVGNVDAQEANRATPEGVTALHQASLLGMADAVVLLLQGGADPSREDKNGFCALQAAAQGGDVETIRLLLCSSIDPSRKNRGGKTALDIAAKYGHVDGARLLSADARVVRASRYALAVAALNGFYEIVALLLSAGADPNDAEDISPPLLAAAFKGRASIVKLLLDAGARVDQVSGDQTPLFVAASEGYGEVVRLLLAARADVTWRTTTDRTLLHQAAQSGEVEIVEQLADAGAQVDAVDQQGLTPLHVAASLDHAGVVHSLARRRADLDRLDGNKLTPLHRAVHETCVNAVDALLSAGASPAVAGQRGLTPLLLAVALAPPGLTQESRFSVDEHGTRASAAIVYTPVSRSTLRIIRLLAAGGADIDAADEARRTALHWAVCRTSPELASLLLELGADRNRCDQDGHTPLDLAEAAAQNASVEPLIGLRMRALASLLGQ